MAASENKTQKRNLSEVSTESADMELTASQFDQLIGSIQSVKSELLAKQDSFEDKLCAIEGKLTKLDAIGTSIDSLKIKQEEQCAFNYSFNFKIAALKEEIKI